MIEIKFRVWDKINKNYIFNIQECVENKYDNGLVLDFHFHFDDFLNDKNYIIEQYTVLKDKNGKEIYEGDIDEEYGEVVFHKEYLGFFFVKGDAEKPLYDCPLPEIIGNKHENSDLLKR